VPRAHRDNAVVCDTAIERLTVSACQPLAPAAHLIGEGAQLVALRAAFQARAPNSAKLLLPRFRDFDYGAEVVSALRLVSALSLALLLAACGPPPPGTIGAILGHQGNGRLFIRATPAGLGAAEAGVRPGDEILFIDGIQVTGLTSDQISQMLRGPVGAPVQLTLQRGEQIIRVSVTRTEARRYAEVMTPPPVPASASAPSP